MIVLPTLGVVRGGVSLCLVASSRPIGVYTNRARLIEPGPSHPESLWLDQRLIVGNHSLRVRTHETIDPSVTPLARFSPAPTHYP